MAIVAGISYLSKINQPIHSSLSREESPQNHPNKGEGRDAWNVQKHASEIALDFVFANSQTANLDENPVN